MNKVFLVLLSVVLSTTLWAKPITKLIVFGDSLSDTGNTYAYSKHQLPPAPWYYQGRYSNGPIWIDRLAEQFFPTSDPADHVLNYSFGGSGVLKAQGSSFLLRQEVDSYLVPNHGLVDEDALYVIWMGANDYLTTPDANETDVDRVVAQIKDTILRLRAQGARHVLLISLADLGKTPFARELELTNELSTLTELHNQKLREMFIALQNQDPDLDGVFLDMNQFLSHILDQATRYGLVNLTDKCLQSVPEKSSRLVKGTPHQKDYNLRVDCPEYLFFDQVHPTTEVHQIIAAQINTILVEQGFTARI